MADPYSFLDDEIYAPAEAAPVETADATDSYAFLDDEIYQPVETTPTEEEPGYGERALNVGASFIEGAARSYVEAVDPATAERSQALDIGDEGAEFASELGSGIGQGVGKASMVGTAAVGGAAIGVWFFGVGAPIGAAISGGGAAVYLGVQSVRRQLFGVEDQTQNAYKLKHGVDAPKGIVDQAKDDALGGILVGEAADLAITVATGGIGKIVYSPIRATAKVVAREGLKKGTAKAIAKETTGYVARSRVKAEAAKHLVGRVGKTKIALTAGTKAFAGEFTAETIQTATTEGAVTAAVEGTSFVDETMKNLKDPKTYRAGLIGGLSAAGLVGGSKAAGVDAMVENKIMKIGENAAARRTQLQADMDADTDVSKIKIIPEADEAPQAGPVKVSTSGAELNNEVEAGLDTISEGAQARELGLNTTPDNEAALGIAKRISAIENDEYKDNEISFSKEEISTGQLKAVYGKEPNLVVKGNPDGSTTVTHLPEAERQYHKTLRDKTERLDIVNEAISEIDQKHDLRDEKARSLVKRLDKKKEQAANLEKKVDEGKPTAEGETDPLTAWETVQDQVEKLEQRIEKLQSPEEMAKMTNHVRQRVALMEERDSLHDALGEFVKDDPEDRSAAKRRAVATGEHTRDVRRMERGVEKAQQQVDAKQAEVARFEEKATDPSRPEGDAAKYESAKRDLKKRQGRVEDMQGNLDALRAKTGEEIESGVTQQDIERNAGNLETATPIRVAQTEPAARRVADGEADVTATAVQDAEDRINSVVHQKLKNRAAKNNFKTWLKTKVAWAFSPRRGVGEAVFDAHLDQQSNIAADVKKSEVHVKRLTEALKKEGVDLKDSAMNETLNDYLAGDRRAKRAAAGQLSDPIRAAADDLRQHVTQLSQELKDSGAIQGDLVATFDENMDTYLTRSYEVFSDPKWIDKVVENHPVMQRAIAMFRDQVTRNDGESDSDYAGRVTNYIRTFLTEVQGKGNMYDAVRAAISQTGKSKKLGILQQRKNIAPEIRALLGEKTVVAEQYLDTVTNQAQLLNTHKFLSRVRFLGLRNGFMSHGLNTDKKHDVSMASPGSEVMTPLNGMYTTPEFKTAFDTAFAPAQLQPLMKTLVAASATSKLMATVYSPQTHVRNFIGNVGFLVANGHMASLVNPTNWNFAKDAFSGEFSTNEGTQAAFERYQRLNLISGVDEGEFRAMIADFGGSQNLENFMSKRFGKVGRAAHAGTAIAKKMYRAEDSFWKVFAFEAELKRQKKIHPDGSLADLERDAAKKVQLTMPNYELVPLGLQQFRRIPALGPFISFHVESIRNLYNSVELGVGELKSDNKYEKMIGASRIVGSMVAVEMYDSAVTEVLNTFSGTKEEEIAALRTIAPPWDQNGALGVAKKTKDGEYMYANFSSINPFGKFSDTINAVMREDLDMEDAVIEGVATFFEPFLSEDLMGAALMDIARNKRGDTGVEVYNKHDTRMVKIGKGIDRILESITPGGVKQVKKLADGFAGNRRSNGKPIDPWVEGIAIAGGTRLTTTSPKDQAFFKGRDYRDAINTSRDMFTKVVKSKATVSDGDLRDSYDAMVRVSKMAGKKALREIQAMRVLGVADEDIFEKMYAGGVPKKDLKFLIYLNEYPPLKISKGTARGIYDVDGRMEQFERATGVKEDDLFYRELDKED